MIVRKMLPQEIDITVNLCKYYKEEASIPDEEYFENDVVETIRLYSTKYEYCWLNAYEGQRPIGLVAGYICKAPWGPTYHAHCELIFLLESHRNMENFKQLIKAFEEWARICGAKEMTAGDIGINVERTKRIFGALGFKEGCWMNKELDDGEGS